MSSRGSVAYGVVKGVARIPEPLTGNTIHHVNNSKEFAGDMKKTRLEKGECIISYDVSALCTSIPVTSAIKIMKNKSEQDTELHKRTTMPASSILELLEFCLCNTYFLFQGQFYEQTKKAAMGFLVSPIVANLYMESFEPSTLTTAVNPPRIWKRYVDDTCYTAAITERRILATHYLCGSFHQLYHRRWFCVISGLTCNTTGRWNLNNQCI